MRPRELVQLWVEAFNRADPDGLAAFYSEHAVNHQVAEMPVQGKGAIRQMFATGFASATMVCVVENIFEDGEWAILEWKDPLGLRGCGFFHVVEGKINSNGSSMHFGLLSSKTDTPSTREHRWCLFGAKTTGESIPSIERTCPGKPGRASHLKH